MKETLIKEILIKSTCDDGRLFIESSADQNKGSELYTHLSKGHKVISSKYFIKLGDDQEIFIPVSNIIELLPDRTGVEPPRDCRRPNILREYDNENTTLYS